MREDLKRLMGKWSNTTEKKGKKQMNLNLFAQDNLQSKPKDSGKGEWEIKKRTG